MTDSPRPIAKSVSRHGPFGGPAEVAVWLLFRVWWGWYAHWTDAGAITVGQPRTPYYRYYMPAQIDGSG